MNRLLAFTLAALTSAASAAQPELSFKAADGGVFTFDTGAVVGQLEANDKSQGIRTFKDAKTKTELAYGGSNPGLLSFYRLLSVNKRWADGPRDTLRVMGKSARLLPDGAVEVRWPPRKDHPIEITATYRWKTANCLDLQTTVKPEIAVAGLEVFLSSYFNKDFRSLVYLNSARHTSGKPAFLSPDVSSLVVGTYLAFPRDLEAAKAFYDGRWELGHSPVQWSVTRYYAAPLVIQRNQKAGITFLQMTRPPDCFAVDMPYNMEPPDGVAGHRSTYFSLFGQDFKPAQSATAHTRLIVGPNISDQNALKLYNDFLAENP